MDYQYYPLILVISHTPIAIVKAPTLVQGRGIPDSMFHFNHTGSMGTISISSIGSIISMISSIRIVK